jgi:hypothetical protein
MTKPPVGTDKLRALTEDPELRALMERYYSAPTADCGPILKAFAEKADALYPDWRETVERSRRDGVYLRAVFIHTLKEARARSDLTEFEQFQIKDLEAEVATIFSMFTTLSPGVVEFAVKLALAVQEVALLAGFAPEEVFKLKLRALVEGGRKGGKNSRTRRRENKPWAEHATGLAQVIYSELPDLSDEEVAVEIKTRWKLEDTLPPTLRTLERFMPDLRDAGKLPKRAN